MDITLPYVHQPAGKTHYRYRRKVPDFLRQALGKTTIILPLGRTPAEVLRHYDKAHKQAEAMLKAATKGQVKPTEPKTELERYRWATRQVAEWGPMDDAQVDAMAAHLEETGQADLYRALVVPDRKPEPTLTDAVRLYLKEKVEGTPDETKKRQRVERVRGHVEKALGRDPDIRSLTRTDAREVRDHMQADGDMSAATVHRYLNDLRAVITHAIKEMDIRDAVNPFNKLEVKQDGPATQAKDARKPFTEGQLKAARARIVGHASVDLQRVWRMLAGTGCRLAEVTGLMVEDVHLDGTLPYLDLRFHPHRRLKNAGSVRRVPLVGDALKAAQEARSAAQEAREARLDGSRKADGGNFYPLFETYAKEGGANVASAALMKHVRKVITDPKVTVHSLRHRIKDKLIAADVPANVHDMILGHSSGNVSEAYGGPEARLEVATRALQRAL
ncbi:tyrosine-type recombinase/integrase [Mesorhizobium escarrei]|uniref:Integrase n=1 Tax=Mesorhizobium escarrei TaxID=666018 RepID=A0ABN8JU00_9HYPH|nr:tyrosine-type recombinase/integrase [Mesorhizobium escarrei]CAH2399593.1 Integrase [Mesorhizobium escarrei]